MWDGKKRRLAFKRGKSGGGKKHGPTVRVRKEDKKGRTRFWENMGESKILRSPEREKEKREGRGSSILVTLRGKRKGKRSARKRDFRGDKG